MGGDGRKMLRGMRRGRAGRGVGGQRAGGETQIWKLQWIQTLFSSNLNQSKPIEAAEVLSQERGQKPANGTDFLNKLKLGLCCERDTKS